MSDTGKLIAELRKQAGYTQQELADALHITDKAVSKWERNISMPDISLLPALSRLLNADIEYLLAEHSHHKENEWAGFWDLEKTDFWLGTKLYDKPAVNYFLIHYLLLGIKRIYVRCNDANRDYLSDKRWKNWGIEFVFEWNDIPENLMILCGPYFLFGSDLSHHFQGAMLARCVVKMQPVGSPAPFLFCPFSKTDMYFSNPDSVLKTAVEKNLGRGMLCITLDNDEAERDAAEFVHIYQRTSKSKVADISSFEVK